jgi:hypothetical protein
MLTFCGFDLEVFIEGVLDRGDWPTLCCAPDFMGGQWLIVQIDDEPLHLERMCAPASERAMQAVGTAVAGPRGCALSPCNRHGRAGQGRPLPGSSRLLSCL